MKRISVYITFLAATLLAMYGCKKNDGGMELNLNAPVDISEFKIAAAIGTIDTAKGTISISLPFGTDFTKVTPAITLPAGAIVSPASGSVVSLKNPAQFRVVNGNIYKDYVVTATETPAIITFKAAGATGSIDESKRTINIVVPAGTDIAKVVAEVSLASGASINPASGSVVDFTNPVVFTVTSGTASVAYTVVAIDETADKPVAFLSTYATRNDIANLDEKAAADWFFATYAKAEYVSLESINSGSANLSKYGMIWWHEDATQNLPDIANWDNVLNAVKAYRAAGGNILLTTFAARWVEALGIVPAGKGPNNVFGDALGGQRQSDNHWGFSVGDHASHPIFAGLPLAADKPYPVVYLLDKQAFRLNHVSWWKVDEWGGYTDAAGWANQTGGIPLAGPDGNATANQNVTIAEFPKAAGNGATIVFTPGSYDWYAEPDPGNNNPSPANTFLPNVQRLTKNAIEYLKAQ